MIPCRPPMESEIAPRTTEPGEATEDQGVDAEHGEADRSHLRRCGRGQGEEDADGERGHSHVGQELQRHDHPELWHVQRQDIETPVRRDADAGDDERPLRGLPEEAVAEHVGQREPQEGRQPDDRVHLAPRGGIEMELVDEEQVAEQRRAGTSKAQDRDGDQLVVQRADAEQPGHGGAEQDPGRLLLLRLQVHARGLEDVTGLVGPLLGLAQREQREPEGDPHQSDEEAVAPVVRDRHDVPEDQDPDRLRQRVRQVVPAEDPAPPLGRVGVGQVRVVHRVVHAGAHRRREVAGTRTPTRSVREGHQRAEAGEDQQRDARHELAAAPVGPHGQRDRPEELRHLRDEGHRAERRVRHVERRLEVVPDQGDAVAEGARHQRRRRHQDERRVPRAT